MTSCDKRRVNRFVLSGYGSGHQQPLFWTHRSSFQFWIPWAYVWDCHHQMHKDFISVFEGNPLVSSLGYRLSYGLPFIFQFSCLSAMGLFLLVFTTGDLTSYILCCLEIYASPRDWVYSPAARNSYRHFVLSFFFHPWVLMPLVNSW